MPTWSAWRARGHFGRGSWAGPWALVAAIALLTAAIGAGPSAAEGRHPPAVSTPARPSPVGYDQPGPNRVEARLLAMSLLAEAWLPPAATGMPVPTRGPLSQPQTTFGGVNLIDLSAAYEATMRTFLFQEELSHEVPPGTSYSGGGTLSGPGTPDVYSLEFAPRQLPSFAEAAQLVYSYYGYGPRTLIRLDAEVVWRPFRGRSTKLPARLTRAEVRSVPQTSPTPLHSQSVSLRRGPELDSLVSAVNYEPAAPPGYVGCAAIQQMITVSFYAGARPLGQLTLYVGCADFSLRLNGRSILLQVGPTLGLLRRLLRG